MNLNSSKEQQQPAVDNDVISFIDYLEVIYKHKKMITRVTCSFAVTAVIISLLLPNIYVATARLLPPQQDQSLVSAFFGQMGNGIASVAKDLTGSGTESDMYVSMLKSDTVKDEIIDRFKLMKVYGEDYRVEAYKQIDKRVDIQAGKKDGIVSIEVEDKSPSRAADIANAFVESLSKMTVRLDSTGAGKNRQFLENRLVKAKADLVEAENAMKSFQSRNKSLDITEQAKGTIKGIADIEAQLAVEEVKLSGLKRIFTDSSQEVKNQQHVVQDIKTQIIKFEGMRPDKAVVGVGSVPALAKDYLRIMREFKIQEALVELLTKQREIAELGEAKNHSSLQVIQIARAPDKKTKPKRALIVIVFTSLGIFFSLVVAFAIEFKERLPLEQRKRLQLLMSKPSKKVTAT